MKYPSELNGDEPTTAEIIMAVVLLAIVFFFFGLAAVWFLAA